MENEKALLKQEAVNFFDWVNLHAEELYNTFDTPNKTTEQIYDHWKERTTNGEVAE